MEIVNIIGGGIGGLTLANALQHHGINFQLYEQAPRITEIGAAISLSKAAQDILDKLGLGSLVVNAGHLTQNFHIADKNLKTIQFSKIEFPVTIIHRAKLVEILSSRLPAANIHLNAKLTSINAVNDHADLLFSDGTQVRSTCTAVADGIHSVSRKQILPSVRTRYARQAIWRGITQIQVPEQYMNTYYEIWADAKRFLFVPMNSGNVFWLAIKNAEPHGKDNPDEVRQNLLKEFRDFHPFVKELMDKSSNFIRSDLADLGTRKRAWYKNNVVFIGDSIHATTPNLAQGGCQAIEDAYCLASLLKKYNMDLARVFPVFQGLREKKVSFIVSTSWNMGKIAHNPILSKFMLTYLKYMPRSVAINLEKRLNDISYLP